MSGGLSRSQVPARPRAGARIETQGKKSSQTHRQACLPGCSAKIAGGEERLDELRTRVRRCIRQDEGTRLAGQLVNAANESSVLERGALQRTQVPCLEINSTERRQRSPNSRAGEDARASRRCFSPGEEGSQHPLLSGRAWEVLPAGVPAPGLAWSFLPRQTQGHRPRLRSHTLFQ